MSEENKESQTWSAEAMDGAPSAILPIMLNAMIVLILAGLLVLAYHYFYVSKVENDIPPRVAILDITEILEIKQLQASVQLVRGGSTDQNANLLYQDITTFATRLEAEVKALQDECNCVLVVKSAVIASNRIDNFTPVVKERLGLGGLFKDDLIRELTIISPAGQPNPVPQPSSQFQGQTGTSNFDLLFPKQ